MTYKRNGLRWVVRVQPRDESVPGPTELISLSLGTTKKMAQREVEARTNAETFSWAVRE